MTMKLTIGDYDVATIRDHIGAEREPSSVYTDVPVEAWDRYKVIALDPDGLWRSVWRAHLIRPTSGDGPVILVDAGMGPGPYAHTGRNGELLDNLAAEGVSPDQVDAVVTTHVHGDHIGWNITWDNDSPRLTFPSATYHIASNDWAHYTTAGNSNEAFDRSVRPLEALGNLKLVEGEFELAPGIRTIPTNGHTPGHQCVQIESGGTTAVLTFFIISPRSPSKRGARVLIGIPRCRLHLVKTCFPGLRKRAGRYLAVISQTARVLAALWTQTVNPHGNQYKVIY